MASRMRLLSFAYLLAAGFAFAPRDSYADAGSEQAADQLFREARELMDQGDNARACELLKKSYALEKADGTLLNLAICEDARGRSATALQHYEVVLARARQQGRKDRIELAEEQIGLLQAKVSRVTVRPSDELKRAAVRITLDGRELPESQWDVARPIDGGEHELIATARHQKAIRRAFTIAPSGESQEQLLAPAPPEKETRLSTAAWGLIGSSMVLGAGAAASGIASLVLNESVAGCNYETGICFTTEQRDEAARAQDAALVLSWVSVIGLPLGAAGTLVGLLLPHEEVELTPQVSFDHQGFSAGFRLRL
jgi:hypothetical protein